MITEHNFIKFNSCPRQAYLTEHDKNTTKSRSDRFLMSGRLRDVQKNMLLSFPDGVTVYGDTKRAAADTKYIIKKEEDTIYNATFIAGGCCARCDVIMRNGDCYDIYAVRPTSRYTRWINEVLYCKIIMQKAGVKTGNCYVCAIDREGGKGKMLTLVNVDNLKREEKLRESLDALNKYVNAEEIPQKNLTKQCGACRYFKDCFDKDGDSIFSLKSLQFPKKMSLYQKGIKTVEDYRNSPFREEKAMREILVRESDEDIYNKEEIKSFLSKLKYPLGFLDFETMEVFNPTDEAINPMDTVITQFSYHLIEKEGEKALHYDFIGDGKSYPEREAAQKLCEYIKENHTVLMYSDYERVCIERLIKRLPEYKDKLEIIKNNLVDLERPFAKKYLVNRRMEGKSSLKKVLPALYPGDSSLSYSCMKIQNGQQAESVYARLHKMPPAEKEKAIHDLRQYCALDTLAMIKLWEKLEYYGNMV